MEELLVSLRTLGQTAPYACLSLMLMGVGVVLILSGGKRRPARPRPTRASFGERLEALGLEPLDGGWDGLVDGRRLRVARIDAPTEDPPYTVELSTPVPFPGLTVGPGDPEQTAIRGSRHVGDSEFDPWFEVQGEAEEVAALTFSVRRALRNAARTARPRIERGWVTLGGSATVDLDSRIAPLFAVAAALDAAADLDPGARLKRFAADPDAGVRMRCLEMLQHRASSPVAAAVARSRLDDADPIVRTLAAVILKDSQRLVTIAKSEQHPAGVRRRAARALLDTGTNEERAEAASALAQGPEPLHSVAWELSGSLGGGAAEPVLLALVGSPNEEVARQSAQRLAKSGSITAIPALREFHERSSKRIGKSAAEALTGTLKAMRPMLKGEPTRPLPSHGEPTVTDDHESPTGWRQTVTGGPATSGRPRPLASHDIDSPSQTGKVVTDRRTPSSRTIKRR